MSLKRFFLMDLKRVLIGTTWLFCVGSATSQVLAPLADFPKQAFTIISPFPPGGGNDSLACHCHHQAERAK